MRILLINPPHPSIGSRIPHEHLPPLGLLWVKFIEAVIQLRPRSLGRVLAHPDLPIRAAMKWYYRIGRQVWPYEIRNFLFRDGRRNDGPTLAAFWGTPANTDMGIPYPISSGDQ